MRISKKDVYYSKEKSISSGVVCCRPRAEGQSAGEPKNDKETGGEC